MKRLALTSVIIVFALVITSVAFAQPMMKSHWSGGWLAGSQYSRIHDPKTVESISGKIVKVATNTPQRGMSYGIHLIVTADNEIISVHLGPSWYIERLDAKIEKGDKVEVKGSRVTLSGGGTGCYNCRTQERRLSFETQR